MSTPRALEQLPNEATAGHLCKVEDTQLADKVLGIGVVLDVADGAPNRPTIEFGAGLVDEAVGGGSKGVDLELVDVFLYEFADNLVESERTLYPALAMQDQDNFVISRVLEGLFDEGVTISGVLGAVEEVAPDEALNEIKENPIADDVTMVSAVDV